MTQNSTTDMTAHWENRLSEISEQTYRYEDFMEPLKAVIQDYINTLSTSPFKQISNLKRPFSFKKKRPQTQARKRSTSKA